MYDARPNLGAECDFARYYKKKGTKELCLSKYPIGSYKVRRDSTASCREQFINEMNGVLYDECFNNIVNKNTYIPIPKASIEINDKIKPLDGKLFMMSNSLANSKYINKHNKELIKLLDYILGTISVCLSFGKDEVVRRELKSGLPGKGKVKKGKIGYWDGFILEYPLLSPFWTTSPILTSFITGLARNCLSYGMWYKDVKGKNIDESLFDNVEYKRIQDIIKNVDRESAKEIYYEVIIPFVSGDDVNNAKGMMLSTNERRKSIKKLIDDGFQTVFRPERMQKHWEKYSEFYGFYRFTNYINNPKSVLKYENYRRI